MLDVTIDTSQHFQGLTLYPLLAPGGASLPYQLLVDAVAAGTLAIGEVGQGTVPALLATNQGDRDVVVLDGEQLIGSRQNRTTNRSILLPARSTTEVPVYCMEHGRWHFRTEHMAPAPQHSPAKVRRRAREVEAVQAASGTVLMESLRMAQSEVWNDVAATVSKLGGQTATGDLSAAYQANTPRLDEWTKAFPLVEDQVGFLAFTGAQPLGLDLIGCHRLYARLHERLLRGYIMDALERSYDVRASASPDPGPTSEPSEGAAPAYLDAVRQAERVAAPTAGKGRYCVLQGQVIGAELSDDQLLAHLSAFPVTTRSEQPLERPAGGPLPPPSRRRRH